MSKLLTKAAFVTVVGRPSAGKSTLVNAFCGQKVAIVSAVPQTTRNAIRGIVNDERGQLVFIDTPGRHTSEKKFNKKLLEVSDRSLRDADLALYVLDVSRAPGGEEAAIAAALAPRAETLVAALNKIDDRRADSACAAAFLREKIPLPPERIFSVSALKGEGLQPLLAALYAMAPAGEPLYPAEYYTDQELDFRAAEIIRGEAIKRLRQELPHAIYVEVADREFRAVKGSDRQRLWIRAFIVCERESQKGMIVGKGGEVIRAIGEASRKILNSILNWRVELDLRVKTGKDWRHNEAVLKKLLDR
ncbi:MAG: GTPase Era [Treponema sp.]|jgi:GTP-binding protein Era|nr:GTPase Era [Treponema sp.]